MSRDPVPNGAGLVVAEPQQALTIVQRYLAEQPWGFFGANCGLWATLHYTTEQADVGFAAMAHEWIVDIPRKPEALGPTVIRYHVNAQTGGTYGDPAHNLNSDFAEGCDKY